MALVTCWWAALLRRAQVALGVLDAEHCATAPSTRGKVAVARCSSRPLRLLLLTAERAIVDAVLMTR